MTLQARKDLEQNGNQVIKRMLTIDGDPNSHLNGLYFWEPGQSLSLHFRWAANAPSMPKLNHGISYICDGRTASFHFREKWALARLLAGHHWRQENGASFLRFEIPLEPNPAATDLRTVPAGMDTAVVYLKFELEGRQGEPLRAPSLRNWASLFPGTQPLPLDGGPP